MQALVAIAGLLLAGSGVPAYAPPTGTGLDRAALGPMAPARLRVGAARALAIVGVGLAAWGASAAGSTGDAVAACRWCEPGALDRSARSALRWDDGTGAASASDALLAGIPAGSALALAALAGLDGGGGRELVEDVALLAGALLLNDPLTVSAKHHFARLRPEPWAAGGPRSEGDLHSFFSGHTSRVFAAAAAATQIARLRGRPGWRWLGLATFCAAAATGWLRLASDQHWATDVLAGAAAGTAVGLALPALALRGGQGSRPPALAPVPGGFALAF